MSDRAAQLLHALMWARPADPTPPMPTRWEELDETQRDAFRDVVKTISRAYRQDTAADGGLREALTEALTAEHYRRAFEGIVALPEEHQAAMADVAMKVIERHG
jgi:hypothetical protein